MTNRPVTEGIIRRSERSRETSLEAERMHDVLLLIEHLLEREETTARLIIDCLYDVGAINLINRKIQARSLNRLTKWIARLSKPAFRIVAMRWFKGNCPQLITNWLHTKVKFEPKAIVAAVATEDPAFLDHSAQHQFERYQQEIRQLNSQVKVLTTLLVGVTISFMSAIAWTMSQQQAALQLPQAEVSNLTSTLKPALPPSP